MANKKVTRRALVMSVVALILCCAMLVGTTFAWFTDSASSAVNTIQSGNLDVDLVYANDVKTSAANKTLKFVKADGAPEGEEILWEPGCTYELEPVKVVNNGDLALKYQVSITGINGSAKLLKVIKFEISDTKAGTLAVGGESGTITITAHMDEDAGNDYQGLTLDGVGITVAATQAAVEYDSYSNQYDKDAQFPAGGGAELPGDDFAGVEFTINDANGNKIGTATVPEAAMGEENEINVIITDSPYEGNFTIGDDQETTVYDIKVEGLKENNDEPIKIKVRLKKDMDPATVKVYHIDKLIDSTYDPEDGYVTFYSATFSPFTFVYDAESKYVPPVADESKLPEATVERLTQYENVDLPWGSFGQWSPTEGLDSQLEACYSFECQQTLEEAKASPYANWYCDFVVQLDRDLGENQIFLGGNYEPFEWVGFHNGTYTLSANTDFPMLSSVGAPWTYVEIVQNVGTFICGAGDVNDALSGAKFTVMLRLTNPENAAEFINVKTVTHTFQ